MKNNSEAHFDKTALESLYHTSKRVIQHYVREIERHNQYKSFQSQVTRGVILDDRGGLIDLYESCAFQDTHLGAVLETVISQIIGERYELFRYDGKGKPVKDVEATKKIQGSQFDTMIRGIVESKWYGYTLLEILPDINPMTGKLASINIVERRNVLPNQRHVVRRQGQWAPGWDVDTFQYKDNYVLINTGTLGLFAATTPAILAKKFTFANYTNYTHTYGQPIIHGKIDSTNPQDKKRLADEIANAAQNKIVVTGLTDELDVKAISSSNSEQIFIRLIDQVNKEVSNLIVGSGSMAGEQQSYVGSTAAHQDIFRDRIEMYRKYITNIMNEEIVPRLVKMGYIEEGLVFRYSKKVEMNSKDKVALYSLLTERYEVAPEEIEEEFGVIVGKQLNLMDMDDGMGGGDNNPPGGGSKSSNDKHIMSDRTYFKRYGHRRGEKPGDGKGEVVNFLTGETY